MTTFLAGASGLAGSAIYRKLENMGRPVISFSRAALCLMDTQKVDEWFSYYQPSVVYLAAARVGGIQANLNHPVEFLTDNLAIQNNVMLSAVKYGARKIVFLGSSCIYPRDCEQPMKEEYFMTGPVEPTNSSYAVAKIAGIQLCQAIEKQYGIQCVSVMPPNLYGVNDNFHPEHSHVPAAMLQRFHKAKVEGLSEVVCWGDGSARREFMNSDDLADACVFLEENYMSPEIINVGTGSDISIKDFANLVKDVVGFTGEIVWDTTKPNGMPRKLMDSSKIRSLGWEPSISLEEGLVTYYEHYKEKYV